MFDAIQSQNKLLTANRYLRLQGMAIADLLVSVPISLFSLIFNAAYNPMNPWISWADTHADFFRVQQWPSLWWRQSNVLGVTIELNRWMPIVAAIVYFGFFGFAQEARKNYRSALDSVGRVTGIEKLLPTFKSSSSQYVVLYPPFTTHVAHISLLHQALIDAPHVAADHSFFRNGPDRVPPDLRRRRLLRFCTQDERARHQGAILPHRVVRLEHHGARARPPSARPP